MSEAAVTKPHKRTNFHTGTVQYNTLQIAHYKHETFCEMWCCCALHTCHVIIRKNKL